MAKNASEPIPAEPIDPRLIYSMRDLLRIWRRTDRRRLEEALERAGVKLKRLGNGLTLVRGQDVWDSFSSTTER